MKFLTEKEEAQLSREELLQYYKELQEYYNGVKNKQKMSKLKKTIHPLLVNIMRTTVKQKMILFNDNKIQYDEPVIYAINHTNSHDVPAASDVIKDHCYILAGNENLRLIERIMFKLNGVIFINRQDKTAKNTSKDEAIKVLLSGNNLMIFPEGTWNTSENKIMLPLNWGIVEIAKKADVPVVPIALEYLDDVYYANVGDPIKFDVSETKQNGINRLRDSMATLRWQIWEQYKYIDRENISLEEFEQELEKAFNDYKKLDRNYEKQIARPDGVPAEEVFKHLQYIKYNQNNAFLLGKNKKIY